MMKQTIDLRTAKKEDLTFTAPFKLVATRDDCKPRTAEITNKCI